MKITEIGPTGQYPRGIIREDDRGELTIGIAHDEDGTVVINFGCYVDWIGMPPEQAIQFALQIMKHAGCKTVSYEVK